MECFSGKITTGQVLQADNYELNQEKQKSWSWLKYLLCSMWWYHFHLHSTPYYLAECSIAPVSKTNLKVLLEKQMWYQN